MNPKKLKEGFAELLAINAVAASMMEDHPHQAALLCEVKWCKTLKLLAEVGALDPHVYDLLKPLANHAEQAYEEMLNAMNNKEENNDGSKNN